MKDHPLITREEANSKRNKKVFLTETEYKSEDKFSKHSDKYDFFSSFNSPIKPGQHFLYEIFSDERGQEGQYCSISYPKLGIYLNSYPCDQTIEIEWAEHRRTWEYNFRLDKHFFVGEDKLELNYLPLWSDQIFIYGVWDSMPNWKQLKQAYEKTWWFYRDSDELRDIQINRILNG